MNENHQRTLLANPWFAGLEPALREAILASAHVRKLAPGQRLHLKGQAGDGWYAVLSGAIKVSATTAEGRETVLTWLEPGTWFGEISLFDGLPRTHDGHAHGATALLRVAPADFERLLLAHPVLLRALIEQQCRRLRMLFVAMEELSTLPVEVRLARQLLILARSYGKPEVVEGRPGTLIDLHLPQDELAQLLGVSRQRVNQALKAWEREGLLHQRYGRIVVLDAARLSGF